MKTPIGLIIKEIVQKKNLSPAELADKMGTTRQTIYNTYNRGTLHEGEINKWAEVLQVSKDELLHPERFGKKSNDNGLFGNEVISEIRRLIEEEAKEKEELRRLFQEELQEKNEQIKRLQNALEKSQTLAEQLLGKLHEYSTSPVMPTKTILPLIPGATAIRGIISGTQHR